MKFRIPKKLLGTKNTKTIKGEKYGWTTHIMYLSPFTQNALGKNVCSHATTGCAQSCLFGAGRGGMFTTVEQARINKTNYLLADRPRFLAQLVNEIEKLVAKNKDKKNKLCVRLNGTSDLAWEKFKVKDNKSIMELFPNVQFYDYTKNHLRFKRELPKNYHLTFSRSEENEEHVMEILAMGFNVAIVFDKLPETYKGYKVVNGDESDLTFLQPNGVILGLKYKNMTGKNADNKRAFESGFALRRDEIIELREAV